MQLYTLQVEPPWMPDRRAVHAHSIAEVGDFDRADLEDIMLEDEDEKVYKDWTFSK
jgi:hypothetical protein